MPISSNSQTTDRTAHNSKKTTTNQGGTTTSREGPLESFNPIQEYNARKQPFGQNIASHRQKNLLETYQPPRYKSQMRGTDFRFKGHQSKFNSYKRDKTPNLNPHDTSRDRSRADSNTSRISRVSWSNVSYQSNFSAIRNDIIKFKNKKLKNMNDSFSNQRNFNIT